MRAARRFPGWAGILAVAYATGCGDDGGRTSAGGAATGIGSAADGTASAGDADGTADSTAGAGGSCGSIGQVDFSYIWIANSPEGTVSKIDTMTAVELGRYRTGPDAFTDPSRTSVNLEGDVAVLNRHGGVVKIAAIEERCVDKNGDGTIQTSTGPADVLPWGEDECVVWTVDTPFVPDDEGGNRWGPRPIAWDAGLPDPEDSCIRTGARLWIGWYNGVDPNTAEFWRLDGETGAVLDTVVVPQWSEIPLAQVRPYGGATNRDGDFWIVGKNNQLTKIDGETLEYEQHFAAVWVEFYGLALDAQGRPWIGGCDGEIYVLNGNQFLELGGVSGCVRGIQIDEQGRGWLAGNDPCRLVEVDTESLTVVDDNIPLPGCVTPVGVSIDVEGYVWVVDLGANAAFKVDPDTHAIVAQVGGLVGPYTYSDMTGAGLRLQHIPEP